MGKFLFDNNLFYRGLRHVLLFVLLVTLFTLIVFLRTGKEDFVNAFFITLTNAFFFFAYGYITIFLLVPLILFKRYFLSFVLAFMAVGFLLSYLKFLISDYVFASSINPGTVEETARFSWRTMLINTKDMSFIVAVFAVAKFTKDWLYAEHQRTLVESRNAEARQKLLQSQFDPHFLFNTLNNLYALSLKNNAKTIEIIQRLKKVLKYLLVDYQGDEVVLRDEVELIKDYIYIEQIRYGKRLKTDFAIEAENCNSRIAPMLFFPLIENCFKHGSAIDAGSPWIELKLSCDNQLLNFVVRNSKPSQPSSSLVQTTGAGLNNLKKRLELLYQGRYEFEYKDLNTEFLVNLKIKL